MTTRAWPAYMYRVPDPGDTRISELEGAVLELNDTAAKLREIALRFVESSYGIDREHAERFLSSWIADPSAWPAFELLEIP